MNNLVMVNEDLRDSREEAVLVDKSAILDKLVVLQTKLDVLDEKARSGKLDHSAKQEHYIIGQLYKLITTMLDCDQDDIHTTGWIRTTKVTRIYRYIPNYVLDYYNQDRIVTGGLFLRMPVFIISADIVKKATKNRYNTVLHPEEFGLPSHKDANYATLRSVGSDSYMVLARGSWLDDWITLSKHWEYVTME